MKSGRFKLVILGLTAVFALVASCSGGGGEGEEQAGEEDTKSNLAYVSEEYSFGVFFDKEGTTRTIELGPDQKEFKAYIITMFPEEIPIKAVQWKLELPDGVEITGDDYYSGRNLTLGNMLKGFSEGFPCVKGPSLLLHTLTLKVTEPLEDAVISIVPAHRDNFLGVVTCEDGNPMIRAASYVGVVNPAD